MAKVRFEPVVTMGNLVQVGILMLTVVGALLTREHWVGTASAQLAAADARMAAAEKRVEKLEDVVISLRDATTTLTANQKSVADTLALMRSDGAEFRGLLLKHLGEGAPVPARVPPKGP